MEENPVISCGGFRIDNSSLIEEDGILKALPGEPKLPNATSENNGKILKIVNGEWAIADNVTILG